MLAIWKTLAETMTRNGTLGMVGVYADDGTDAALQKAALKTATNGAQRATAAGFVSETTADGGTDVGEVLTTAQNIAPGDYDSWHDEWGATADRIAAKAEAQLTAGHRTSARDRLMRASNCYLTARRLPRPSITTLAMMSRRTEAGWGLCRR